jgi:hypothetical protein
MSSWWNALREKKDVVPWAERGQLSDTLEVVRYICRKSCLKIKHIEGKVLPLKWHVIGCLLQGKSKQHQSCRGSAVNVSLPSLH